MKIKLTELKNINEIEIEIKFSNMDEEVINIVSRIQSCEHTVFGNDNGRQYKIKIYDIYYIESVDRKTFIYTKEQVFRSELKLYQLLNELKEFDFVQVNKSCILNINVLESIQSLINSRMEAMLSNGERINISRTYIPAIKAAINGERD